MALRRRRRETNCSLHHPSGPSPPLSSTFLSLVSFGAKRSGRGGGGGLGGDWPLRGESRGARERGGGSEMMMMMGAPHKVWGRRKQKEGRRGLHDDASLVGVIRIGVVGPMCAKRSCSRTRGFLRMKSVIHCIQIHRTIRCTNSTCTRTYYSALQYSKNGYFSFPFDRV